MKLPPVSPGTMLIAVLVLCACFYWAGVAVREQQGGAPAPAPTYLQGDLRNPETQMFRHETLIQEAQKAIMADEDEIQRLEKRLDHLDEILADTRGKVDGLADLQKRCGCGPKDAR